MRPEKKYLIAEVHGHLKGGQFLVLTDYTGMKVGHMNELRKRLAAVGAKMHVVKNSVFRIAAKEAGLPEFDGGLLGPTAAITGSDIGAASKVLKNFTAEFERPKVKVAAFDGKLLTSAEVKMIADLPSREALLAQLLGLIQMPATQLARLMNEPASMIARVVNASAQKSEVAKT